MAIPGFSVADLVHIVERAAPLADRLGPDFVLPAVLAHPARVQTRRHRWGQVVGKSEPWRLADRLTHSGWAADRVDAALDGASWRPDVPLPGWTTTLTAMLDESRAGDPAAAPVDRACAVDRPVMFEDLLLPFVALARRRLAAQVGPALTRLSAPAQAGMERTLLLRLAVLTAPALHQEFSAFRTVAQAAVAGEVPPPDAFYRIFIRDMRAGQLRLFYRKYAVLARLAALTTDFWVAAVGEFVQRLAADWATLVATFAAGADPGPLDQVQMSLSDAHNQGRTVLIVTFESGLKLVYKPKPLESEVAYYQLLAWLNAEGAAPPFPIVRVLARPGYGWAEFVASAPCADSAAAGRYFQRLGALLGLMYVLAGTDVHFENVLAAGEYPVLVDTETLFGAPLLPPSGSTAPDPAAALAQRRLDDSVLAVGLLPRWQTWAGARGGDTSVLGSQSGLDSYIEVPRWSQINTDAMDLRYEFVSLPPSPNQPTLAGIPLSVVDYRAAFRQGFRDLYRFVAARRGALLAPTSPLAALEAQPMRQIIRPSRIYGALLERLNQPQFLRDGADRSIELDALAYGLLIPGGRREFWPLLAAEHQALEQGDIPLFAYQPTDTVLPIPGTATGIAAYAQPGTARVRQRIAALSEDDLAWQTTLLDQTVAIRFPAAAARGRGESSALPAAPGDLQAHALALGVQIRAAAVRAGASASWIHLEQNYQMDHYQIRTMGYSLYYGAGGVALFLAALARLGAGVAFQELALAALAPLRTRLRGPDLEWFACSNGLGLNDGCGALIYSLVGVAGLLDAPELLEDARRVAALITAERIVTHPLLSVLSGTAGAILALLALDAVVDDPALRATAQICGEHLLAKQTSGPFGAPGARAWAYPERPPLAGFAHGAAGIAYALLRLYQVGGDPRFRDAAAEAITYEQRLFLPTAGNWIDLRRSASSPAVDPPTATGWCHGAPGIGLARIAGLPALDTPAIRADIAAALATTAAFGLTGPDKVCCGNLGRADILLTAGQKLGQPALIETARQQATQITARAADQGRFMLAPEIPPDAPAFGFFQGLSGIGYTLLRLTEPDQLPSVLLFA